MASDSLISWLLLHICKCRKAELQILVVLDGLAT
jgi:hypothetical protein